MKTTISVSIAKILFYLEDDAHKELENYLSSLRTHFASDPNSAEIISDIESRIAEQFISLTGGAENKDNRIVTKENVDQIIKTMGNANEFDIPGGEEAKKEKVTKSLYRDPDNAVIGGVASGIASYLGLDPLVMRLIFGISILFGGTGFLVYIIFWIALPEAKTSVQKLEMRGEPVTVESVKGIFKEKVEEVKAHNKGRQKFLAGPLNGIGAIFNFIGTKVLPVLGKIIGIVLTVATILAMLGVTAAFIISIVNSDSINSDIPLKDILGDGFMYLFTMATAFFLIAIPIIFVAGLGTLLMGKKPSIAGRLGGILLTLWLLSIISGVVLAFNIKDKYDFITFSEPAYQESTKVLSLGEFTKINGGEAVNLIITKDEEYSVTLFGRSKDIEALKITNKDGVLFLTGELDNGPICFFCWTRPVRVEITAPVIDNITLAGASRATIAEFEGDKISVSATNASKIDLNGRYSEITAGSETASKIQLIGTVGKLIANAKNASSIDARDLIVEVAEVSAVSASKIQLIGTAGKLIANAKNASSIDAHDLVVEVAEVSAVSASKIKVNATLSISGEASRASQIIQYGSADISQLRTDTEGSSSIKRFDDI